MSMTIRSGNGITNKLVKLRHPILNDLACLCYLLGLDNSHRLCGCAAIRNFTTLQLIW